jgi:predicted RNA-binding Zn-ribbon protein involved in translation (DUF1610 family)
MNGEFICPECGSRKASDGRFVETEYDEADVWSGVLQMWRCADCKSVIPAHLCERWDGLSVEGAQKEWREVFRESQPMW